MPHIHPTIPAYRPRTLLGGREARHPAAATTSASRVATVSACSWVGASTITRTSCSVPAGRRSTPPARSPGPRGAHQPPAGLPELLLARVARLADVVAPHAGEPIGHRDVDQR